MNKLFDEKSILVTGGTGSLGQTLIKRLLSGSLGRPRKIVVLSRDEAKQYQMKVHWKHRRNATEDIFYRNFDELLQFRIGDVRDEGIVTEAVRGMDVVFHAAAMKQVPTCEYFPHQAVLTNIQGTENVIRAAKADGNVEAIVGISTDKACKPINVMGMTKAIQERMLIEANIRLPKTRILAARYGNVISSRGSVIPLFREQIANGGPVTLTSPDMTRFLLSLESAVDLILAAVAEGRRGEVYVPRIPAARIEDVAKAMIGNRGIKIQVTGIRPGEKMHEAMISDEEARLTIERNGNYVIQPALPELRPESIEKPALDGEYSSSSETVSGDDLLKLLGTDTFRDVAQTVPSR